MKEIINIFSNINICFLILDILLFIVLLLFTRQHNLSRLKQLILIALYIVANIFLFNYLNTIIQDIFALKYLSVKTYLIILIITNIITLKTINQATKIVYSIINYSLFIILTIIFGATIAVILGNQIDFFYIMDVSNAINFIDLSIVIFILYLISMSITYIGYYIFEPKSIKQEVELVTKNQVSLTEKLLKKLSFLGKITLPTIKLKPLNIKKTKPQKTNSKKKSTILTPEELINFNREEKLYINGVECNIIFEDSNKDNIYKNYQILSEDINAKLVNGYTLEENKMLKNICMKLQANNIGAIDINNVALLNKISIEEYMLLEKVFAGN